MKKAKMFPALVLALAVLSAGCGGGGKTIIQQGNDTKVSKGMKDIVSKEQGFTTKCLDVFDTVWDDDDGLYIYTKTKGSIPYVLIWRFQNVSLTIGEFIQNHLIPDMRESYGERLTEVGGVKEYEIGGALLPGILFAYKVDDVTVRSLRVFRATADGFVSFNAKYVDEEDTVVKEALDTAVSSFRLDVSEDTEDQTGEGGKPGTPGSLFDRVKITRSEAAEVRYVKYADPAGYFNMEIPSGWSVEVGLKPNLEFDIISYAITLYDPAHPERQLYFNLNCSGAVKTKDAHDWYVNNYGAGNTFSKLPYVEEQTSEGFFKAMGPIYGYRGFEVLENQGQSPLGGDVLIARSTWEASGRRCEGLYSAMLDWDFSYYVLKNPFNLVGEKIDAGPVNAYMVVIENAAEDEIIEWKPVLDHCLASIEFTAAFQRDRKRAWANVMGTAAYIAASADEVSGMIMDSWEKRNASYDVISQKQSDATLGYERVYDTEKNEYYRAETGFGDWYKGDRYKVVEDDGSYLQPISGYIDWK